MKEYREIETSAEVYLAIKAQAPVVPVTLIGTREILAMGEATFHRGKVRVCVGEPIVTEGMTAHDRGKVTEIARERILATLRKAGRE